MFKKIILSGVFISVTNLVIASQTIGIINGKKENLTLNILNLDHLMCLTAQDGKPVNDHPLNGGTITYFNYNDSLVDCQTQLFFGLKTDVNVQSVLSYHSTSEIRQRLTFPMDPSPADKIYISKNLIDNDGLIVTLSYSTTANSK